MDPALGETASLNELDAARSQEPLAESTAAESPPQIPGFRIEKRLGEGGLGAVYEAWDEKLQRKVALKVLRSGRFAGAEHEQILQEARKAAALHDPSIVTIYSVNDAGSNPAIVMEYVQGFPLDTFAAPLTFEQKAALLLGVARALAAAHKAGIIHRDLKPDNILVTPALQPKVLDFGLALATDSGASQRGKFAGTPLYASPEQAGGRAVTTASDVFSFGSLMYKVLTGREPFSGATLAELLAKVREARPEFPRALDARVPHDLQSICLACLARDAPQRPSAEEVAADLSRFLAGEPARLRPALYGDILHGRVSEHMRELRGWLDQGIISAAEGDRLAAVYRRILADEDHWILDARRLSKPQTILYTGTWAVVVGTALLVWLARDNLPPLARWLLPAASCAALAAVGIRAQLRREALGAAAFLAGATLASVPAVLAILGECGLLGFRPLEIKQLLPEPFANRQVLVACMAGAALSIFALLQIRLTAFAWTTAVLAAAVYTSFLLTRGLLDLPRPTAALWLLPLVSAELAALRCERIRQVRWAAPFHLIALIALVVCLDVMAYSDRPTLEMLGFTFDSDDSAKYLSLAFNAVIFFALMVAMETAASLDLRRGSKILEVLIPLHLMGPLYLNAHHSDNNSDVALYLGAVAFLLAMAPWRNRGRFLLGGFAGIALGSYLLIDKEIVAPQTFAITLVIAGFLTGIGAYAYTRARG